MDDTIMDRGKWKGKTYKYIRIHDPLYVFFLVSQPAAKVVPYFKFIEYCIDILKMDDTTTKSDLPIEVTDYDRKNTIGYVYCFFPTSHCLEFTKLVLQDDQSITD